MADAALEVITTLAVMADNGSVVEVGRRTFELKILLSEVQIRVYLITAAYFAITEFTTCLIKACRTH